MKSQLKRFWRWWRNEPEPGEHPLEHAYRINDLP